MNLDKTCWLSISSNALLPRGSMVVPFRTTCLDPKYKPQKGTTMEPMAPYPQTHTIHEPWLLKAGGPNRRAKGNLEL